MDSVQITNLSDVVSEEADRLNNMKNGVVQFLKHVNVSPVSPQHPRRARASAGGGLLRKRYDCSGPYLSVSLCRLAI